MLGSRTMRIGCIRRRYSGRRVPRVIEKTVLEQQRALFFHRRRQEMPTARRLLRESDEILFWLEECMVQGLRLVPGWIIPRLVTVLAHADPELPRELGSERRPAQLMELVFRAQERLMEEAVSSRGPARVIPLFRNRVERGRDRRAAQG